MAPFDPEVNVLLDFTEDRVQKPFTVEAKIAYGIVASVTWDERRSRVWSMRQSETRIVDLGRQRIVRSMLGRGDGSHDTRLQ